VDPLNGLLRPRQAYFRAEGQAPLKVAREGACSKSGGQRFRKGIAMHAYHCLIGTHPDCKALIPAAGPVQGGSCAAPGKRCRTAGAEPSSQRARMLSASRKPSNYHPENELAVTEITRRSLRSHQRDCVKLPTYRSKSFPRSQASWRAQCPAGCSCSQWRHGISATHTPVCAAAPWQGRACATDRSWLRQDQDSNAWPFL